MRISTILAAAIAILPIAAQAETIRLTPEQAEAAKEAGAAKRQRAAELGLPEGAEPDRGVHGEVGVAIGTGGYRSFYGVAALPLGDTGGLVLAYNQERGRVYGPGRGNLCRGINDGLCDLRLENGLYDARR